MRSQRFETGVRNPKLAAYVDSSRVQAWIPPPCHRDHREPHRSITRQLQNFVGTEVNVVVRRPSVGSCAVLGLEVDGVFERCVLSGEGLRADRRRRWQFPVVQVQRIDGPRPVTRRRRGVCRAAVLHPVIGKPALASFVAMPRLLC